MKKTLFLDYLAYLVLKITGPLIRLLPLRMIFFLGKVIGGLLYYFDLKHRSLAYANIKKALGDSISLAAAARITRDFYRNFGQSLIEIFVISLVDKKYFAEHIEVAGRNHIDEAFKKGKGVILLGVHAGSWELSNIICANMGFPFSLLVRDQKLPYLNRLLNSYRQQKGCRLIQRRSETRQLVETLKNNESIGLTGDQGGKTGVLVKFFGRTASMPTGAIRMALKYGSPILPAYYTRVSGPNYKVIIEPPFELKKTLDKEKDIRDNLQKLVHIFEKLILRYPEDYLWTYKIWKYSSERNILILNDGITGHLRQSQALAKITQDTCREKGILADLQTVEVKFRNKWSRFFFTHLSVFSGKYSCQGCLICLRKSLNEDSFRALLAARPDIIISCGSTLSVLNYILAKENLAKSVVIMRPAVLSTRRFDLVVVPEHDRIRGKAKNIVVTQGALNLIDSGYLKAQASYLSPKAKISKAPVIGLLIGGDSKKFRLSSAVMQKVITQIKAASEKIDAEILVTTSRRTPAEVERLAGEEFKDYPRCKLLVIANEKNFPFTFGGILGLSNIIVASPESISMVSEAVNSKKYTVIFNAAGLSKKHRYFLDKFAKDKYIYLTDPADLGEKIIGLWSNKPETHAFKDNLLISEAVKKII